MMILLLLYLHLSFASLDINNAAGTVDTSPERTAQCPAWHLQGEYETHINNSCYDAMCYDSGFLDCKLTFGAYSLFYCIEHTFKPDMFQIKDPEQTLNERIHFLFSSSIHAPSAKTPMLSHVHAVKISSWELLFWKTKMQLLNDMFGKTRVSDSLYRLTTRSDVAKLDDMVICSFTVCCCFICSFFLGKRITTRKQHCHSITIWFLCALFVFSYFGSNFTEAYTLDDQSHQEEEPLECGGNNGVYTLPDVKVGTAVFDEVLSSGCKEYFGLKDKLVIKKTSHGINVTGLSGSCSFALTFNESYHLIYFKPNSSQCVVNIICSAVASPVGSKCIGPLFSIYPAFIHKWHGCQKSVEKGADVPDGARLLTSTGSHCKSCLITSVKSSCNTTFTAIGYMPSDHKSNSFNEFERNDFESLSVSISSNKMTFNGRSQHTKIYRFDKRSCLYNRPICHSTFPFDCKANRSIKVDVKPWQGFYSVTTNSKEDVCSINIWLFCNINPNTEVVMKVGNSHIVNLKNLPVDECGCDTTQICLINGNNPIRLSKKAPNHEHRFLDTIVVNPSFDLHFPQQVQNTKFGYSSRPYLTPFGFVEQSFTSNTHRLEQEGILMMSYIDLPKSHIIDSKNTLFLESDLLHNAGEKSGYFYDHSLIRESVNEDGLIGANIKEKVMVLESTEGKFFIDVCSITFPDSDMVSHLKRAACQNSEMILEKWAILVSTIVLSWCVLKQLFRLLFLTFGAKEDILCLWICTYADAICMHDVKRAPMIKKMMTCLKSDTPKTTLTTKIRNLFGDSEIVDEEAPQVKKEVPEYLIQISNLLKRELWNCSYTVFLVTRIRTVLPIMNLILLPLSVCVFWPLCLILWPIIYYNSPYPSTQKATALIKKLKTGVITQEEYELEVEKLKGKLCFMTIGRPEDILKKAMCLYKINYSELSAPIRLRTKDICSRPCKSTMVYLMFMALVIFSSIRLTESGIVAQTHNFVSKCDKGVCTSSLSVESNILLNHASSIKFVLKNSDKAVGKMSITVNNATITCPTTYQFSQFTCEVSTTQTVCKSRYSNTNHGCWSFRNSGPLAKDEKCSGGCNTGNSHLFDDEDDSKYAKNPTNCYFASPKNFWWGASSPNDGFQFVGVTYTPKPEYQGRRCFTVGDCKITGSVNVMMQIGETPVVDVSASLNDLLTTTPIGSVDGSIRITQRRTHGVDPSGQTMCCEYSSMTDSSNPTCYIGTRQFDDERYLHVVGEPVNGGDGVRSYNALPIKVDPNKFHDCGSVYTYKSGGIGNTLNYFSGMSRVSGLTRCSTRVPIIAHSLTKVGVCSNRKYTTSSECRTNNEMWEEVTSSQPQSSLILTSCNGVHLDFKLLAEFEYRSDSGSISTIPLSTITLDVSGCYGGNRGAIIKAKSSSQETGTVIIEGSEGSECSSIISFINGIGDAECTAITGLFKIVLKDPNGKEDSKTFSLKVHDICATYAHYSDCDDCTNEIKLLPDPTPIWQYALITVGVVLLLTLLGLITGVFLPTHGLLRKARRAAQISAVEQSADSAGYEIPDVSYKNTSLAESFNSLTEES